MPYATNPLDGVRSYYEDPDGARAPVLFLTGFMEPLAVARGSGLARLLRDRFRLIYVDHRGHGRSDKPHDAAAYALATRCADVVAVLDELGIDRAHVVGISWGARLGFALAEHVPTRLRSLVLCGNQPYEWRLDTPLGRAVVDAMAAGRAGGMQAVVETFESRLSYRHPEPMRTWVLESDPLALDAAFRSVFDEGAVSDDLARWRTPCLIVAGADDEMHDDARRAASEIPDATFLSLPGHSHLSAPDELELVAPHVLALFGRTS